MRTYSALFSISSSIDDEPGRPCPWYSTGCLLIVFLLILYFVPCAALAAGISLRTGAVLTALLCVIASAAAAIVSARKTYSSGRTGKNLICSVLAGMTVIAVAVFASAYFLDSSYDGQTYQQLAVLKLLAGWNPFLDPPLSAEDFGVDAGHFAAPLNSYPKFPWIAGSVLAAGAGTIEAGKALHLLLLACVGCFAVSAGRIAFGSKTAWLSSFALLAALNPVAVCQSSSFYVDGIVASLIGCFLLLSMIAASGSQRCTPFLLAGLLVLMVNTKFTGLLYALLLAGVLCVMMPRKRRITFALACAAGLIAGVFVFGYHPYITNLIRHGSPLYPISKYPLSGVTPAGEELMNGQLPADLQPLSRGGKLFRALFSMSSNVYAPGTSMLRYPWQASVDEFSAFWQADVRLSGFGPLFALGLVLSCCAALIPGRFTVSWSRKFSFCIALLLFASVLANPEGWWARYAPQLWLVPVVLSGAVLAHASQPLARRTAGFAFVVLLINVFGVSVSYLKYQIEFTRGARAQLSELAQTGATYRARLGSFASNARRLQEYGIVFETVDRLDCANPVHLPASHTVLCAVR